MHLHSRRRQAGWLFWGCIAFFSVVNSVGMASSVHRPKEILAAALVAAFCYGAIPAQMALHSIWCVLAPLHWAWRLLVGATTALILYGVLVTAYAVGSGHGYRLSAEHMVSLVISSLCLPLLLLAVQTPLWIVRIWFRWRIAHRDDSPTADSRPWRITDLMTATAAIAIALAAVELSQAIDTSASDDRSVRLAVAALIIMVTSGITVLPVVVGILRLRRLLPALGLAFTANLTMIVVYLAQYGILRGALTDWETFGVTLAYAVGSCVSLIVPMLIARKIGYRLLWGQKPICSGNDGNQIESRGS